MTTKKTFTLRTGDLLHTMGVAAMLGSAKVHFTIRPDTEANASETCTCGSCCKFLLSTSDAGISMIEAKAGEIIPEDLYVYTDRDGKTAYERRNPASQMAAPSTLH